MSESVSSLRHAGMWEACEVDSVDWKAVNGRLLGGGAAGEGGEEVSRAWPGKGADQDEVEGPWRGGLVERQPEAPPWREW